MNTFRSLSLMLAPLATGLATPALAQPFPGGGWGNHWDEGRPGEGRVASQGNAEPSGKIEVATFRAADAGDLLGKGRIVVSSSFDAPVPSAAVPSVPGDAPPPPRDDNREDNGDDWKLPVYEAAVVDQLGNKGYDIAQAADPTQIVQIAVSHDTVVPEEAPHKPVSGAMETTISNRGTGFGLALAVDLSKPRKAIVATRLDVRIRDRASGRVLWEGHAEGQARLTDSGSDDTKMATRLATALFRRFPDGQVVQPIAADHLAPPPGGE